ncbi:MAG: hypothetical protein NUV50_01375 [Rhodospirillales bacterium]|nr:hypothetical protein [Rhodospirillales bacterium]
MNDSIKRLLFILGIALAGAAFVATGTEIVASALNPDLGRLPSAAELWRAVSPATFEAALAQWPMIVSTVLTLPAWLLLGAPGITFIIIGHERDEDAAPEIEQSLYLFDELTRRAREDGFADIDDFSHSTAMDFHPADPQFIRDSVADDLIDGHDYLLDPHKAEAADGEAPQADDKTVSRRPS